jgi:DNA polymerase
LDFEFMMSSDRSLDYLRKMGIETWAARTAPPFGPMPEEMEIADAAESPGVNAEAATISETANTASPPLDWCLLQQEVSVCTRCPLHKTRTQTVFGVGNPAARWMIIGEAPGEQEDLQGEPFVGRAGLLLNEMIKAVGFSRDEVYIANVLKCRPPRNRDPSAEEAAACESYLKAQLALVKPGIILAVGRIAAQNLLKTTTPIGKLRGVVHAYQNIPLVVTYHPAYLLRSQTEKRRAWEDLKLARRAFKERL